MTKNRQSATKGATNDATHEEVLTRESGTLPCALYLVSTPIGNLSDITLRALDVLKKADQIYCEDTRQTQILLRAYDIRASLKSYHEHNGARMRPLILAELEQGRSIALVSDAGTPLISDPGYKLVRACVAADHNVIPIPGASAPLAALSASGLPSDHFFFAGFLPVKTTARKHALETYASIKATLVFFESARRLSATLSDMAAVLGSREAVVARELTKKFEEFKRGDLRELARFYESAPPRGEVTLLVAPFNSETKISPGESNAPGLEESLKSAFEEMSLRDAVAHVTQLLDLPRAQVYAQALALKKNNTGQKGNTPKKAKR